MIKWSVTTEPTLSTRHNVADAGSCWPVGDLADTKHMLGTMV